MHACICMHAINCSIRNISDESLRYGSCYCTSFFSSYFLPSGGRVKTWLELSPRLSTSVSCVLCQFVSSVVNKTQRCCCCGNGYIAIYSITIQLHRYKLYIFFYPPKFRVSCLNPHTAGKKGPTQNPAQSIDSHSS